MTGFPEPARPADRLPAARRTTRRAPRSGPDRLALWAVVLGLLLAIVAATTARGDERPASATAPPAVEISR